MNIERDYFFEILRTEHLLIQKKSIYDISYIFLNRILTFNQMQLQKRTKIEPYKHKKKTAVNFCLLLFF